MATIAPSRGGAGSFLREALTQLGDRRWLGIALLFFLFLGGTNAVLALYKPAEGSAPSLVFALAGLVRIIALILLSVAALRIATGSSRARWKPDGGFFLYLGLSLLAFAAVAVGAFFSRAMPDLQRILVTEAIGILLIAPITVWTVAAAVERPLALSPSPHLRNLGAWLPAFLLWTVLLVLPLATAHAVASLRLVEWVGQSGFWLLALVDALVSTLLVMITLALRVTAYRSVARA